MNKAMIERADEAACKLDGMFRDIFNQEDRYDLLNVALTAAMEGQVVYPAGPRDKADEITAPYRAYINSEPELMSILYDIDMLPEQTVSIIGAIRLAAFCEVWKKMATHRYPQDSAK